MSATANGVSTGSAEKNAAMAARTGGMDNRFEIPAGALVGKDEAPQAPAIERAVGSNHVGPEPADDCLKPRCS